MAKKEISKININLSSKEKATVGKVFYGWAINAGRAIIVGIELIALMALGYRLIIDRQIVDQKDAIHKQELYIANQSKNEAIFRGIQARLQNIKITDSETSSKIQVMNEILKAVDSGTFFSTNLSISGQTIIVNGSTFSIFTLTSFLDGIKNIPSVAAISIDEINTADDGIKFKIHIDIKDLSTTVPTTGT